LIKGGKILVSVIILMLAITATAFASSAPKTSKTAARAHHRVTKKAAVKSTAKNKAKKAKKAAAARLNPVKGILHKVKRGETLWDISSANNAEMRKVMKANHISSPNKLKTGQVIILPGTGRQKAVQKAAGTSAHVKSVKAKASHVGRTSSSTKTSAAMMSLASRGTTGSLVWPLKGIITSYFGMRKDPITQKRALHDAIDIAAPIGTDIKAADDGVVIFSSWKKSYGNYVKISHGNGVVTGYAHNSKILVSVGQHVSKGQIIAKLGTTGRSTGPHLDFGVIRNGIAVNPLMYLR
jgi:murein DD-endopeptidase MepM/ murein hydrolase activator NlpD